jgi:hypothetical protein
MGERPIEAEIDRMIPAGAPPSSLPASRRKGRRHHPMRNAPRLLRVVVASLGVTLLLAACQNRDSSSNAERRDGFYGGVTGGWSRP